MISMEDYLRHCERELAELRAQLEPLESGSMHTGEKRLGGPWTDTTARDIERLKKSIKEYEGILARRRNQ